MYYITWWLNKIYSILSFLFKLFILVIIGDFVLLYFIVLIPLLPYFSKSKTYFGWKPLWKFINKLGTELEYSIFG